jgi:hypothetical protein
MALTVTGLVVGALLGLCFEITILVPAIICALIMAGVTGMTSGLSTGSTVLAGIAAVIALQLGYVAGSLCRSGPTNAWATPEDSAAIAPKRAGQAFWLTCLAFCLILLVLGLVERSHANRPTAVGEEHRERAGNVEFRRPTSTMSPRLD